MSSSASETLDTFDWHTGTLVESSAATDAEKDEQPQQPQRSEQPGQSGQPKQSTNNVEGGNGGEGEDDSSKPAQNDDNEGGTKGTQIPARQPDEAENQDSVYAQLYVRYESISPSVKLDQNIWKDNEEPLPLYSTLHDVLTALQEETAKRLQQDTKLIELKKRINFSPALQLIKEVSRYADLDSYGKSHTLKLRNIFAAKSKGLRLPITVTLEDTGKTCRSTDADELVTNGWYDESEYYRVGTINISEDDNAGVLPRRTQWQAVLAWYKNEEEKKMSGMWFSQVPSWKSTDFEIGDNDLGQSSRTMPKDTVVDDRYGTNAKKLEVHKLLSDKENNEVAIAALRKSVPQALTQCFNDKDEDMVNYVRLENWPDKYETITARGPFVHYEENRRKEEPLVPQTFNIKVKEDHDLDDIYNLLDNELRRKVGGRKKMETRFKDNKRQFQYDLWVRPQMTGVRKMFRYRKGKVMQFMTARGVNLKEDVYMEANIVPMAMDDA
jgi:hypothetical protein